MKVILKDRALLFHHLEWVLLHPRFGIVMFALIALSFTHNQMIAAGLFVLFTLEVVARFMMMMRKARVNPYRASLNRRLDTFLLFLDVVGILSLLITVFDIQVAAENVALVRLVRASYLLRTLRVFRYVDLHSVMFSPAYGMFISLVIIASFFAVDLLLWAIIIYFFVELSLRFIILKHMKFESEAERRAEWMFWWFDMTATVCMIPWIDIIPYSGVLRMLRLVRLFRPWRVIISNLMEVLKEGQFLQEITLIILMLAILSLAGGGLVFMLFDAGSYVVQGHGAFSDQPILAAIWFAFRLLTDPGNSALAPDNAWVAMFTIASVILGVFVFAFFIGIGANIVSGLMKRLKNERLVINNHLVIFGWTGATGHIIKQLALISERNFSKIKVILLNESEAPPVEVIENKWVTYRYGAIDNARDLSRVHISAARQALINLPKGDRDALSVANAFHDVMAVRKHNDDIGICLALPGMNYPRLKTHRHMLQVGWDNRGKYDKPTTVISETDFRTTALCNMLRYSDFDQVFQRLMIPELPDDSNMFLVEWDAHLQQQDGVWFLHSLNGEARAEIKTLSVQLFERGVVLVGFIMAEDMGLHPLYRLDELYSEKVEIKAILGVAISDHMLLDELLYCVHTQDDLPKLACDAAAQPADYGLNLQEPEERMQLLVVGWVGALPLLLKRLMRFYHELDLVILDDIPEAQVLDEKRYIESRLSEEQGLEDIVSVDVRRWNFSDMEYLRDLVVRANHIIIAGPHQMELHPYALISNTLSSIVSIANDEGVNPQVFPILENREQAHLLQEELSEFELPLEVNVSVLNEFYGSYVAHATFNMYSASDAEDFKLKRTLRHSLDKLMSDTGEGSEMGLKVFTVETPLPENAADLYYTLLEAGYIWIGYTMKHPFVWQNPLRKAIQSAFPRKQTYGCHRQNHIIINPLSNPVSRRSWLECRDDIIELITIGGDNDIELF